jgi:hypothetical protein
MKSPGKRWIKKAESLDNVASRIVLRAGLLSECSAERGRTAHGYSRVFVANDDASFPEGSVSQSGEA